MLYRERPRKEAQAEVIEQGTVQGLSWLRCHLGEGYGDECATGGYSRTRRRLVLNCTDGLELVSAHDLIEVSICTMKTFCA